MQENKGRARIWTKGPRAFLVTETAQEVAEILVHLGPDELIRLTSVTGQVAFPPEVLFLRGDEVAGVQEVSDESWVWQQRADELHYARQIQEQTDAERYIEGVQEILQGMVHGDEDE